MKRVTLCVAAVALLCWTAGAAWAQEPKQTKAEKPKAAKAETKKLKSELAKMDEVVKLTDEQKTQIAALEEAMNKDVKAFQTENQGKFAELDKAIKDARAKGDKEALAKLEKELAELRAKRELITKGYNDKIMAVLTSEQKAKWLEHLVVAPVLEKLKAVNLTPDQTDKIKAAYIEKTAGVDLSVQQNRVKASKALMEYARTILTPEQQEKLKPVEKPKAGGDKPAPKNAEKSTSK